MQPLYHHICYSVNVATTCWLVLSGLLCIIVYVCFFFFMQSAGLRREKQNLRRSSMPFIRDTQRYAGLGQRCLIKSSIQHMWFVIYIYIYICNNSSVSMFFIYCVRPTKLSEKWIYVFKNSFAPLPWFSWSTISAARENRWRW